MPPIFILLFIMLVCRIITPDAPIWHTVSIPLFIFGGLVIFICYYIPFAYYVFGKRSGSLPAFFGGICLAIAILMQPIIWLRYFWWTAFIIDYTWILFLYSITIHRNDWKP